MRTGRLFRILTATGALLLGGCESTWEPATKNHRSPKIGVIADLPEGWTRYTQSDTLALTREGPLLQTIVVSREPYGTEIENTDRTIAAEMLPHEAAQVLIDSMAADPEKHRFEVLQNGPAEIDGRPGFRADVRYKTGNNPTTRASIYGILTEEDYILATYKAPDRHYHERSINDFESTVASFIIDPPPEGADDVPPQKEPENE